MAINRERVIDGLLSFQGGELLVQCGKTKLLGRDTLEKIKEHLKCNVVTMDGKAVDECYYWMSQAILWGLHDYMPGKRKTKNDYKILFWESLHTLQDPRPELVKVERKMKKKYYASPLLTITPEVLITIKQEPLEIDSLESTLDVLEISSIKQKHDGAHLSSLSAQKSPHASQGSTTSRAGTSAAGSAASLPDKQQSSSTKHSLPGSKRPSVSNEQPSLSSKQPSSSIERPSSSSKQPSSSEQRSSVSKTRRSSTQTNAPTLSTHMPPPPTKAKQQKSARQHSIRIVDPSPEPSLLPVGGELIHKTPIPHGRAKTAKPDDRFYSVTLSCHYGSFKGPIVCSGSSEGPIVYSGSLILSVRDGGERAVGHISWPYRDIVFALHRLTYGEWIRFCSGDVWSSEDGLSLINRSGRLRINQDDSIEVKLHWAGESLTIYEGMMVRDGEVSKNSLRLMEMHEEELLKLAAQLSG
ncbi:unnamed protein product [Zymoseptoria tritici ST99CH_3D1]|nr:unnamed protein product [Zymoseptoria tritici ST99CH_3D1]